MKITVKTHEGYWAGRFEIKHPKPDIMADKSAWGLVGWLESRAAYVALKTGKRDVILTEETTCCQCGEILAAGETMIKDNPNYERGLLCMPCVKEEETT